MVLTNQSMEISFRALIESKYHGVVRVENLHAIRVNFQTEVETIGATLVFNYSEAAANFEERTLVCTKEFGMNFRDHRIICPHMYNLGQDPCDFSVDASAFLATPAGMSSLLGAFIFLVLFVFLAYKQATRDPGTGKKTISFGGGTAFNNPLYALDRDTSNPLYDDIGNHMGGLYADPLAEEFNSQYLELPPAADVFGDGDGYFDVSPEYDGGQQYADDSEGYLEMDASMYEELGALDNEDGYLQMSPKEEKKQAKAAKKAKAKSVKLAAKKASLQQDTFEGDYLEMGEGTGDESGYLEMEGAMPVDTEYLDTNVAPPTFVYHANKSVQKEKKKKKQKQQLQPSWDDMSGGMYMDVGAEADGFGF
jgi:hypothetical protein